MSSQWQWQIPCALHKLDQCMLLSFLSQSRKQCYEQRWFKFRKIIKFSPSTTFRDQLWMDLITDTGNPGYYLCNSCICVTVILKQIQIAKQRGHKADAQQLFPVQKKASQFLFCHWLHNQGRIAICTKNNLLGLKMSQSTCECTV